MISYNLRQPSTILAKSLFQKSLFQSHELINVFMVTGTRNLKEDIDREREREMRENCDRNIVELG